VQSLRLLNLIRSFCSGKLSGGHETAWIDLIPSQGCGILCRIEWAIVIGGMDE
jgi:hypothetical protein